MLPLCVDLDGTLIKTDTLWESIILLAKKNILLMFLIPCWLLKGKAYLKFKIANSIALDVSTLPYQQQFLAWLMQQHQQGRELILVTAANETIANAVASHLGIFSKVYASSNSINLKGRKKQELLTTIFGDKQYDYAGNANSDLTVWTTANKAILVNASNALIKKCQNYTVIGEIFGRQKLTLVNFLKAIRIHQYTKNVLIFIPLLLGHFVSDIDLIEETGLGFICFSLLASSVYLLNDLLDLPADRFHPSKRYRALAAGDMSIAASLIIIVILLVIAGYLAFFLPIEYRLILVSYYALTVIYSFFIKQQILADVLMLATLYTLRILAGMAILGRGYSDWLILFSLFFFTSLAFVKRYTELVKNSNTENKVLPGRGYAVAHTNIIHSCGIASGYLSALVFALYINSEQAMLLYQHPRILYLVCPLILYWLSRIWFKAAEGKMHDDPVIYALYDKASYFTAFMMALLVIIATV